LAAASFMGYLFGGVFGLIYGFGVGIFSLVMVSHVKIAALASVFLAALGGLFCGYLHSGFNLSFTYAFLIVIIVRTIIAFPVFSNVGIDPIENTTHQTSQLLVNLIVYLPLLSLVEPLLSTFLR
jgi:hypothetical protein